MLIKSTLHRALAEPLGRLPASDVPPWLLGLQRAIYVTMGRETVAGATTAQMDGIPARGVNATWRGLHQALLRLPDRQREVLVLADGAYCRPDEIAPVLDCSPASARRLVRHARAGLLPRLRAPQPLPFPSRRPPTPRRPAAEFAPRPHWTSRQGTS